MIGEQTNLEGDVGRLRVWYVIMTQKYVLWLQITMHNSSLTQRLQSCGYTSTIQHTVMLTDSNAATQIYINNKSFIAVQTVSVHCATCLSEKPSHCVFTQRSSSYNTASSLVTYLGVRHHRIKSVCQTLLTSSRAETTLSQNSPAHSVVLTLEHFTQRPSLCVTQLLNIVVQLRRDTVTRHLSTVNLTTPCD